MFTAFFILALMFCKQKKKMKKQTKNKSFLFVINKLATVCERLRNKLFLD